MLDHDDRERLQQIAERCQAADARFAEGLRAGTPISPREYHSGAIHTVTATSVTLFMLGLITGGAMLVAIGLMVGAVAVALFYFRSLDGPTG
jgi:Flp pilus assembly protein TadB